MFKKIRYDQAEGMVIRVKTNAVEPKVVEKEEEFICKECGFVAKTKLGLIAHSRKHKK